MFDLHALLWLTFLAIVIYYWFRALQVKERAFIAVKQHCAQMDVQLLDEAIYLRRLWIKRDERGQLCWWRAFYFEFTATGEDRYTGRVLMLGNKITDIQLAPHRLH